MVSIVGRDKVFFVPGVLCDAGNAIAYTGLRYVNNNEKY